ncbi:MAG TPA: ankyrin repeat domain-containing protein [Polyangiaceae bacterium LLY-WYZ-15_(1-7)]|nr:hypothetical protein [Myxococcales bacterium]MAT27513.1 hypothetical protein [Sandaracinus sp.]HJL01938.1 ankyrin repeat domain-containing protein [Polyangiaceae bacterium LLY-WYZ-15_(1-7)]MBJ71571.1 hypothetical protein [Sandaracinus sp.]HJL11358.1 ankyrin repeat domain-containing protein [Polyangiaceae bacterium LLY-WYZ-15_(1-7)]
MRRHYVLSCPGCGAPAADCVRICPYCGNATGFEGLGLTRGVRKLDDGTVHVGAGAQVEIGASAGGGERPCPFCGAPNPADARHCGHCGEKVMIERMRVSRLVVEGGRLTVGKGGRLEVVGRKRQPIHDAAGAGDLAAVRARVEDGDDPDMQDERGGRPLHDAAGAGSVEVVRWLISVGAEPDAKDDAGRTPRAVAEAAGHPAVVDALRRAGG